MMNVDKVGDRRLFLEMFHVKRRKSVWITCAVWKFDFPAALKL